jgi:hypothetical protein
MASPSEEKAEPFPALSPIESVPTDQPRRQQDGDESRRPATSSTGAPASTADTFNSPSRRRTSSIRQSFLHSNPPLGMWQATGEVTSKVPSLAEIRNGSFASDGWNHEGQLERRGANPHEIHRRRIARTSSASTRTRASSNVPTSPVTPTITEHVGEDHGEARLYFPRRGSLSMKEIVQEQDRLKNSKAAATSPVLAEGQEPADTTLQPSSAEYVTRFPTTISRILTISLEKHRSTTWFPQLSSLIQPHPRRNKADQLAPTQAAPIPMATAFPQSTPGGNRL